MLKIGLKRKLPEGAVQKEEPEEAWERKVIQIINDLISSYSYLVPNLKFEYQIVFQLTILNRREQYIR